jgi:hypothetical protein
MSYLIYINGNLVELDSKVSFTQTKQVNDIANITNRNSNFTQTIKAPRTANNRRTFEGAFNVGSTADIPYQRAVCNVIDTNSGQHLIYNGWAVLIESTNDTYNFTVYDGIIDFYKKIEKLTINDLGVSELNHIKNLEGVIETWTNESLPYRYILADYNGKNTTDIGNVNVDYQVPCASGEYLWNKIFDFIGFEYEGSIFEHEEFKNLWISYPKPTPITEPVSNLVTTQTSTFQTNQVQYPNNGGTFYGGSTFAVFLPDANNFDTDFYNATTGVVVAGVYRFEFSAGSFQIQSLSGSGSTSDLLVSVIQAGGTITTQTVNIQNPNYIDIFLNVGDKIVITLPIGFTGFVSPNGASFLTGSEVTTTISQIEGYSLGFDQAFIDYKVTDFIKEIVIRFGLTPYKDKYTDKIKFLTLYEVLQTNNIIDLTDKFVQKVSERYAFGNYAQRNLFKYKYNDEFMKHNDGFISIDNENIAEEVTLLQSNIFSPERLRSSFLDGSNVYKIWEREVKDDGELEFKDLDGRFYFLRAEKINEEITIGSETLGGTETSSFYFRENYWRLDFKSILNYWYSPIKSIFDKSKLIQCDFNLKELEIYNFKFDSLIYIEQLASYYLLNKIQKTEGKQARLELIEVDYFTQGVDGGIIGNNYQITIGVPTLDGCEITIPLSTNYPLPTTAQLVVYNNTINGWVELNLTPIITAEIITNDEVVFDITQLPEDVNGYRFAVRILADNIFNTVLSNISDTIDVGGSCYVPPTITELEITNVNFISTTGLASTYSIAFDSDVTLPVQCMVKYFVPQSGFFGGWSEYQQIYITTNPFNFAVGIIFGSPTKFQIKIGDVESAIFDL